MLNRSIHGHVLAVLTLPESRLHAAALSPLASRV